jgi:hypothetical protein
MLHSVIIPGRSVVLPIDGSVRVTVPLLEFSAAPGRGNRLDDGQFRFGVRRPLRRASAASTPKR